MASTPAVALSPLEEERFGVRTARAAHVTAAGLPEVLEFCRAHRVELLIARCTADDLAAAQALEARGGLLTDTLIYYVRDLEKNPPAPPAPSGAGSVRPVRAGEEESVAHVAAEAFRGYTGHYHADPRLDRTRCDEAYISWTRRSCLSREVAGEVLVHEIEGEIAAFATLRMNSTSEGEGVLFGVAPHAQGRGIYRLLVLGGLDWCRDRGARRMVVSTQLTNLAVQKVWVRAGFEPSGANYTFHLWLDRQ